MTSGQNGNNFKYKRKCLKIKEMPWGKYIPTFVDMWNGLMLQMKIVHKREDLHAAISNRSYHVGAKIRREKMNIEY